MTTATATVPNIELDATLMARIRQLAERRGESPSRLVQAALDHLERREQEAREEEDAFYQEALEAERQFRETGLHITLDELSACFDRLKIDPNAPLPPFHT